MDVLPAKVIGNELGRPSTPNSEQISTFVSSFRDTVQLAQTPANTAQVQELHQHIVKVAAPLILWFYSIRTELVKACQALANAQIQRSANIQLLAALEQKKQRANRSNEHCGFAQVMGFDVI